MEDKPMNNPKHTPAEERNMELLRGVLSGKVTADEIAQQQKEEVMADISPRDIAPVVAPERELRKEAVPVEKPHGHPERVISFAELSQPPEKDD